MSAKRLFTRKFLLSAAVTPTGAPAPTGEPTEVPEPTEQPEATPTRWFLASQLQAEKALVRHRVQGALSPKQLLPAVCITISVLF